MTTKAKKMKRNAWKEVLLDVIGTTAFIVLIGMLFFTLCIMKIGNRQTTELVSKYGIKNIEKTYIPEKRMSVKEEMDQYIASLPVPSRTYTSIHEECLVTAKAQLAEMMRMMNEAIAKNPTLGMEVVGMTPLIYAMNTSAYCPCIPCCGKTDGQTASGPKARQWYTVAAGEAYNFGTIIYVPTLSDKPNGGWFVVQDRGGAISDDKLDIYFDSHLEALQYGRRQAECWIFKK